MKRETFLHLASAKVAGWLFFLVVLFVFGSQWILCRGNRVYNGRTHWFGLLFGYIVAVWPTTTSKDTSNVTENVTRLCLRPQDKTGLTNWSREGRHYALIDICTGKILFRETNWNIIKIVWKCLSSLIGWILEMDKFHLRNMLDKIQIKISLFKALT